MLCGPIEIDDELTSALENDKLVIFAGAGISMPAPSNIDNFSNLANAIGKKVGVERDGNVSEDRFLGRLEDGQQATHVHQLARSEIMRADSRPTELHELLLQLFKQPKRVRLVTTNFDAHFNTAAKAVFGESVSDLPVHCAPSLPLGDDFRGLVYLHGVLHDPQDRCVLTDRDFGSAYLTHGWARRFILRMYSKYTVLFVGYSHNDMVMNYLARGLPDAGKKYAFVPFGEESNWGFLRIKCVSYEKHISSSENRHIQITEACREWVAESQLSPTKRYERLKHLYQEGPQSLKIQDSDFVIRCLADDEHSYGFLQQAPREDWIKWLLERGKLDFFFEDKDQLLDYQHNLLRWVILKGFPEAESVLWKRLKKQKFHLNPNVCQFVLIQVRQREEYGDEIFKRWLAVLLNQTEGRLSGEDLASLIEVCKIPEEAEIAFSIFASQLRPKIEVNSWGGALYEELGIDEEEYSPLTLNTCSHGMHELRSVWDEHLKPHLHTTAFLALQTFIGLLIDHRAKAKLIQNPTEEDIVSRSRENVESGHEISGSDAIDLIITGATQSLEAWLENGENVFDCLAESWNMMDVPIIRRIVVHGQSIRRDWNADRKLKWLTEQESILGLERKREANLLIMRHYPAASEEARGQLLSWLESWSLLPNSQEISPELDDVFSIVNWLVKETQCSLAQVLLDKIRTKLPSGHIPWEHPEVGSCSLPDDFFRPKEADLAAMDAWDSPLEKLDGLLKMLQTDKHKHKKSDLVYHAIELGRDNINWAIDFQYALINRQVDDREIWNALFNLWREKELSAESWEGLLNSWLAINTFKIAVFDLVVDFLNGRIASHLNAIPEEYWGLAAKVANHCWQQSENEPFEEPNSGDVLFHALNRSPGEFANFWIKYTLLRRKKDGDSWQGLPTDIEYAFNLIVSSSTNRGKTASIMLCYYFDELQRLAPQFVSMRLAPMFAWPENDKFALWYWEAFLGSGCVWPIVLTEVLLPSFTNIVRENVLPKGVAEHAIDLAAWLTIYRFENPLEAGWFEQLLKALSNPNKMEYARLIGVYLMKAQWENQTTYWRRWILEYCTHRHLGVPVSLSAEEEREMLLWCLGAADCLPDAFAIMKAWDVAPIRYSGPVLRNFVETELPERHPVSSAQLLTRLLQIFSGVVDEKLLHELYKRLSAAGVPDNELEKIRDEAIKSGITLEAGPQ